MINRFEQNENGSARTTILAGLGGFASSVVAYASFEGHAVVGRPQEDTALVGRLESQIIAIQYAQTKIEQSSLPLSVKQTTYSILNDRVSQDQARLVTAIEHPNPTSTQINESSILLVGQTVGLSLLTALAAHLIERRIHNRRNQDVTSVRDRSSDNVIVSMNRRRRRA